MTSPDRESLVRFPVGDPLHPTDAFFLRHELRKLGIPSTIRIHDRSGERHATHIVEVIEADLEAAGRVRRKVIDEHDKLEGDDEAPTGRGRLVRVLTGPFVLGVLGAVAGIRVGSQPHGSPWAILSVTVLFVALSSGLGHVLRHRALPASLSEGDEVPPEAPAMAERLGHDGEATDGVYPP